MNTDGVIESVVRRSYGRLVAFLASRTRDVAGAEDALGEALLRALQTWPVQGVPADPEAWLVTVARRKTVDQNRKQAVAIQKSLDLIRRPLDSSSAGEDALDVPDERIALLFVCAHPAIDRSIHAPLMLQTVLGISAEKIATSFLVAPRTMSQRLVRAKAKILDAGIAFQIPEPTQYASRLESVLEAIYAAYGNGWETSFPSLQPTSNSPIADLARDAVWLAKLLVDLQPEAPEVHGLLALMLY